MIPRLTATVLVLGAAFFHGCASRQPGTLSLPAKGGSGGPVWPAPKYIPDPEPGRVKTLLFLSVPPDYLAERAEFFSRNRVDGIMMNGVMNGWESDVWQQPTGYTPGTPPGRVVGPANPLFAACKRANDRCREVGVQYNSVKVAFSRPLPDWFDDPAWSGICANFRQGAVFARDAGFAGISLDIEYVAEQYKLSHPAYQVPGYPKERLPAQAFKRGHELLVAMLDEFPDMVFWLLPEVASSKDWLANNLFAGMVQAMAERDAPGGMHLCTEESYLQTRPRSILWCMDVRNRAIVHALDTPDAPQALPYWRRHGSLAVGLWPLGYYREIYDEAGKLLGYTGREERFHGRLVGSTADKSENYSVDEFRRAFAAARLVSKSYVWIYCHGQVLWQMTPEEVKRYHATENDALPVVSNLDEYLAVLRGRRTLDEPPFVTAATGVRNQQPLPHYPGFAPRWWIAGPFPHDPKRFDRSLPPEAKMDLHAKYGPFSFTGQQQPVGPVRWRSVEPDPIGFIDLHGLLGKPGTPVAYAVTWVDLDRPGKVFVRIGTNDYGAVWVNGKRVYRYAEARPAAADDDSVPVELPAGRSRILMKCGDAGGAAWGFYLRVTDENGNAVPGLRWTGPTP